MRVPERIELERDTRTLVLHWTDVSPQRIAYRALRDACACAACRRRRIDGNVGDAAEDIVVTEVRPMGYGIQLMFSDGHDRGIFPWSYLATAFSGKAVIV
jgi:DUF971 family protein